MGKINKQQTSIGRAVGGTITTCTSPIFNINSDGEFNEIANVKTGSQITIIELTEKEILAREKLDKKEKATTIINYVAFRQVNEVSGSIMFDKLGKDRIAYIVALDLQNYIGLNDNLLRTKDGKKITISFISKKLDMHRHTVSAAMKTLIDKKVIAKVKRERAEFYCYNVFITRKRERFDNEQVAPFLGSIWEETTMVKNDD